MSEYEKTLVSHYAKIIGGLSKEAKQELIAVLLESIDEATKPADKKNFSFDGFIPEKSVEEIVADLRASRHFREKDLNF